METKEMTCIRCPMGCRLTVTREGDEIRVTGNTEFTAAKASIEKLIHELNCPAAECFLQEFIGSYQLNLDELQQKGQKK